MAEEEGRQRGGGEEDRVGPRPGGGRDSFGRATRQADLGFEPEEEAEQGGNEGGNGRGEQTYLLVFYH